MTREEAISALKTLRDVRLQGVEWTESLDMAIEALQADAVSREEYEVKKNIEKVNEGIRRASKELEDKGLFQRVDFVEVIRCKDCRWWEYVQDDGDCIRHTSDTLGYAISTNADDFCSYGERREE